jgi:glucose-1-phosphate adenylyltransferase
MENTVAVILGGGQGSRLFPLTHNRAKPAVPIAGKFRLVDIPISNCLNAGLRRIFILTQFNSESLHRHIFRTYVFDPFNSGFIQVLAAQQTPDNQNWYQGTADAVRQNLRYLRNVRADYVVVLAGDHLYKMDIRKFVGLHIVNKADITVATLPVEPENAGGFGVLKTDAKGRIVDFHEKPREKKILDQFVLSKEAREHLGISLKERRTILASMGIYVFSKDVLIKILESGKGIDFGKHIIPDNLTKHRVFSYVFNGYWEDIGTIRSFYQANLDLCSVLPKFNFYDENDRIYTRPRYLPGSKVQNCNIHHSLLSDGSILEGSTIERSLIGLRTIIRTGTIVRNTYVMGADFFQDDADKLRSKENGIPNVGIGEFCEIDGAIIDKNARIGNFVKLINKEKIENGEKEGIYIRDGIIIVPKGQVVPDHFVL